MLKKVKSFLFCVFLILSVLSISCKEKNNSVNTEKAANPSQEEVFSYVDGGVSVEFENAFIPDYSPVVPEKATSIRYSAGIEKSNSSIGKGVVPGVRELSKYKTKYSDTFDTTSYVAPKPENLVIEENGEFKVEDYGPKIIVAESKNPVFYVQFSLPVKEITALEKQSDKSDVMTIEPKIKGVFRWQGTQRLVFEASEAAKPAQEYKIIVNENLKSLGGSKFIGENTFVSYGEELKITTMIPAWTKENPYAFDESAGLLPEQPHQIFIRTNYELTKDEVQKNVKLLVDTTNEIKYSVQVLSKNGDVINDNNKSQDFLLKFNEKYTTFKQIDLKIADHIEKSFLYLIAFNSKNVWKKTKTIKIGEKELDDAIQISFTHKVDENSVCKNSEIPIIVKNLENGKILQLTKENVVVNEKTITLFNMDLRENNSYEIQLLNEIKDIYGRNLENCFEAYKFEMARKPSFVKFLDSGAKILEAQFAPKLLIEYENIFENSVYGIRKIDDDENIFTYKSNLKTVEKNKKLNSKIKNTRLFEEIPLDEYLNNGKGFIQFEADVEYERYTYWDNQYKRDKDTNSLCLQVTDIGVTARVGINKVVALVTSLSTGEAIEGATVRLCNAKYDSKKIDKHFISTEGISDSAGVAIINISKSDAARLNSVMNSNYAILVEKDGDKTLYRPNSHNTWEFNVFSTGVEGVLDKKARTFMFVDRKIYKPGETVTYRGIDRDQLLGKLTTPSYDYQVSLEESGWNPNVLNFITGTLSKNGGFYGSFKLPNDIKPGTYSLVYKRKLENLTETQRIYIIVAEFERAKFQAAVEMPKVNFVAGDVISASISASYLAGGSLGEANYKASWFKNPTYYKPESLETQGYSFGPNDYYSGRDYYSDSKGVLNSQGEANVTSNTEKISGGKTYRYRLEAAITDASNQRIVASNSVFVHPAKFYIGVSKPLETAGFVKANTKLEFPYILTTPDGKILENTKPVKSLKYKLCHTEWTLVQEKGVNGHVYTRYNSEEKIDAEGTVSINSRGKLAITPKVAGWYTLTIIGIDANGNEALTDFGFYATGSNRYSYWMQNGNSLKLTPNQSVYNPGDTAQVLLESPLPKGTYLITVEREGIFTEEVRKIESATDVIDIKIASNYAPVVYVSVSSYSVRNGMPTHQYGEPDLDKPKGYYGVTKLNVSPAIKAFSVEITADKPSYRPGDIATLTLKATKGGRPFVNTELTVMAVDRGIIDLVDYHVDDPINFFYTEYQFPLRVCGGDNRAYLMDPVTYSIKNLVGGDADETKEDERKDFRPTALFEPEVVTDEKGEAKVTFVVPDSLTTYRVTAFGVKDDLFALSENEIQVRNPVNIQQVQPRRLRINDTAEAGVLITNLEPTAQNVTISLKVQTPSGNTVEDENEGRVTIPGSAFVDGKNSVSLKVNSGETAPVYFDVAATEEGTVEFVYTIKSESINEKLISPIKIEQESTYIYETVTSIGTINDKKKSEKQTQSFVIPLSANDNKNGKKSGLKITLDATRLGLLGSAVNYVFHYPYGCLEQQSAQVLPLIIFGEYIDVFGLQKEVSNSKKCAVSFMKKWKKLQLADGSFSYWPSGSAGNEYVSTRILHIAALAKARGYSDSEIGFDYEKLAKYVQKIKKSPYALYVLSLYGKNTSSEAIEQFKENKENYSLCDISYLGLACILNGDDVNAKKIADYLRNYIEIQERSVTVRTKGSYCWYDGDVSLMANMMQLFCTLNADDMMVDNLLYTILQSQRCGYWHNTAETARVLESVYVLIKARNLDKTNLIGIASIAGNKVMEESFKGVASKSKTLEMPFNSGFLANLPCEKSIPIEFEKEGNGNLYYTFEMKYPLPFTKQTERNEGLGIKYVIEDYDTGEEIKYSAKDSTLIELEAGKMYRAKVSLSSARNRTFIAMRSPIPSGAEILNSALAITGSEVEIKNNSESWGHWLSNTEIYDNEVDFYWNNFRSGETTVEFTFRAVRRGVYPTPSVFAECMYEPEIFGRSNAALFVIK